MTLRVTVEIIPHGIESGRKILGCLEIVNVTEERTWKNKYGEIADYRVRGFPRSKGFWELIKKAIDEQVS